MKSLTKLEKAVHGFGKEQKKETFFLQTFIQFEITFITHMHLLQAFMSISIIIASNYAYGVCQNIK